MYSFEEYVKRGYSVEQINQILLADDTMKSYLICVSPHVPENIFRLLRQKSVHSLVLINKINTMTKEELVSIENNENFFDVFESDTIELNPISLKILEGNRIILGTSGTGKSFTAKLEALRYLDKRKGDGYAD